MSHDQLDDGLIEGVDDFECVLTDAVEQAIEADIDIRGAWEFRTGGSTHDWEVIISKLAKRDGDD